MENNHLISILETFDMETGTRTVLMEFHEHIEAPNWTMDGKSLVYNSKGNIYLFNLETKKSEQIYTGNCNSCNNDHVLSADGKSLAISSGSGESWASRIWVLPIGGGLPRLITNKAPSYLHGWSPDGNTLAYCAERNGEYDIYTIGLQEGAEEIRLTDAPGLNDGPEYSPDGHYLWFHSVRSGLSQVWRMKADGSEQTQMTFDDKWNNWFPHISPDSKHVVYVSYHKGDVAPDEHPANKNVEIRAISNEGGVSTSLIQLFGGQGTMNVNSWSPDSKQFAFISYRFNE
jgi:TolB protein